MKFEDINKYVEGVPFIALRNARLLYDLIITEKMENVLELGIAHGTATCYMAAALDELGRGKIDSVDLLEAKENYVPSPEEQLRKAGLEKYVKISRMETGYNWFLHNEIRSASCQNRCEPKYDLCIIDGPKNWTIDGCAFFLVDKLIKNSGWIIFDDYLWTYETADKSRGHTDGISHRKLSEEEIKTPQIKEVFELLVMQHPNYSEFIVHENGDWAQAKKMNSENKKITYLYYTENKRDRLISIINRLRKYVKIKMR